MQKSNKHQKCFLKVYIYHLVINVKTEDKQKHLVLNWEHLLKSKWSFEFELRYCTKQDTELEKFKEIVHRKF